MWTDADSFSNAHRSAAFTFAEADPRFFVADTPSPTMVCVAVGEALLVSSLKGTCHRRLLGGVQGNKPTRVLLAAEQVFAPSLSAEIESAR